MYLFYSYNKNGSFTPNEGVETDMSSLQSSIVRQLLSGSSMQKVEQRLNTKFLI